MPWAPGRADVGRATATTVAKAYGRPAAESSAARSNRFRLVVRRSTGGQAADPLLAEDRPDLLRA